MQQQQMEMQQQQIASQQQGQQIDPEIEQMKLEAELAKQQAKHEQKLQEITTASQAKREEFSAQKLAELQKEMTMQAMMPPQTQEKPRPASKK